MKMGTEEDRGRRKGRGKEGRIRQRKGKRKGGEGKK